MSESANQMALRDMVQMRALGAIFSGKVNDGFALKGGFAMRVLANSMRYTKDIDIAADHRITSPNRIKTRIGSALRQLQREGLIEAVPEVPQKDTETTIRYKISGMVKGTSFDLAIEVSRRDEIDPERIQRVRCSDDQGTSFIVDCCDLNSLAVAKISCLASPVREAPRDVYDLAILIAMNTRPSRSLIETLPPKDLLALHDNLWDKIEKLDYAVMSEKLLHFFPPAERKEMTEERWSDLRLNVGYAVQSWIDDVISPSAGFESGR